MLSTKKSTQCKFDTFVHYLHVYVLSTKPSHCLKESQGNENQLNENSLHRRNRSVDAVASDDAVEEVRRGLVGADVRAAGAVLVGAVFEVVVIERLLVVVVVVEVVAVLRRFLLLLLLRTLRRR